MTSYMYEFNTCNDPKIPVMNLFQQFCFLYHDLRLINEQHFNLDSGQRYSQETGNKIQQYDHVGL